MGEPTKILLDPEVAVGLQAAAGPDPNWDCFFYEGYFATTIKGRDYTIPLPTVKTRLLLRDKPDLIDWHKDDLAWAKLLYLLNNQKDDDEIARIAVGDWPDEEGLLKPYIDLYVDQEHDIHIVWVRYLKAQRDKVIIDIIGENTGQPPPFAWATVLAYLGKEGQNLDKIMNKTGEEITQLLGGIKEINKLKHKIIESQAKTGETRTVSLIPPRK